jgi:hypothetical protein
VRNPRISAADGAYGRDRSVQSGKRTVNIVLRVVEMRGHPHTTVAHAGNDLWLPNIPSGRIADDLEHHDMTSIDDRVGQHAVVRARLAAQVAQADGGGKLDLAGSAQHRVPFRTEEGATSWIRPTPIRLALPNLAGNPEIGRYHPARHSGPLASTRVGRKNRIPRLSGTFIDMVQAAEHWPRNDTTAVPVGWCRRRLFSARRPLSESAMRPPAIVVRDVVVRNPAKMPLIHDQHVVQAFRSN